MNMNGRPPLTPSPTPQPPTFDLEELWANRVTMARTSEVAKSPTPAPGPRPDDASAAEPRPDDAPAPDSPVSEPRAANLVVDQEILDAAVALCTIQQNGERDAILAFISSAAFTGSSATFEEGTDKDPGHATIRPWVSVKPLRSVETPKADPRPRPRKRRATTKRKLGDGAPAVLLPRDPDKYEVMDADEGQPRRKKPKTKADDGGEPAAAPKKPKHKRRRRRDTDDRKTPLERFARHIRLILHARSKDKTNFVAFADAVMPDNGPNVNLAAAAVPLSPDEIAQDVGDTTGLHPREVDICKRYNITTAAYRCQKARFFMGIAIFVERNYQALKQDPTFKPWNVSPTHAQMFGNIDANKLAEMCRRFEAWGWVGPMFTKVAGPGRKSHSVLSSHYLGLFPEDYRRKLMKEVDALECADPTLTRLAIVAEDGPEP